MFKKISILFFTVVCLTFLQTINFAIFSVKPNLALVAIIIVAFFIANIWEVFLLVILSALILKFSPGFSGEILIFSLITFTAIVIRKYLPWHLIINILFLIIVATVFFYIFSAPGLIISIIFLKELVYNIIIGFLIFIVLHHIIGVRL